MINSMLSGGWDFRFCLDRADSRGRTGRRVVGGCEGRADPADRQYAAYGKACTGAKAKIGWNIK